MRGWLQKKKSASFSDLLYMYIGSNVFMYVFVGEYFWVGIVISSLAIAYAWEYYKKLYKKRTTGLKVEDTSSAWLIKQMGKRGVSVEASVQMKYGDIDIYLPELKIVIDVKSYRKIDSRVESPSNMKSMRRQMAWTDSDLGIIWLPQVKTSDPVKIEDGIWVVTGKRGILNALKGES